MTAMHAVGATPTRTIPDDDIDPAIAATLAAPLPDLGPTSCGPAEGLILSAFLRPHQRGLRPYLVELDLNAAVDVFETLPEGARVLRWHRRTGNPHVLASYDGCLLVVRSWKRSSDVWVSGPDKDRVTCLAAELRAKVPSPPKDTRVRVTFWHKAKHSWHRSRDIDVPTWAEVAHLYPATVRNAMERLIAYRPTAVGNSGGRLLLWQGPPGMCRRRTARRRTTGSGAVSA